MTSPSPTPARGVRPGRRTAVAALAALVLTVAAVSGCSSDGAPVPAADATSRASTGNRSSSSSPVTVTTPSGATITVTTPTTSRQGGSRTRLEGFGEVTITVTTADGETRTWCLLLADTESLRQRGLMFVDDPALGGYDGMLFTFDEDTNGGFWMKNTHLPLSIAFLRADGSTTSITDMAPCPASASTCPTYPSGGTYRNAIEVPKGGLGRLGISDRSKVVLGAESCLA